MRPSPVIDKLGPYPSMLDGYISALNRISTSSKRSTVNYFQVTNSLEDSIQDQISQWGVVAQLQRVNRVDYSAASNFIRENLFDGLVHLTVEQVKLLDWDIKEFFGLMSTHLDSEGPFNPLVSNGGYVLEIDCEAMISISALLVEIDSYGVMIVVSENA